jgi:NADH-quinone oxidoreductase subunit G
VFNREDTLVILHIIQKLLDRYTFIQESWNGYNILHTAAAQVGGIDVGFVPSQTGYNTDKILTACQQREIQLVYLLGIDKIPKEKFEEAFIIYQGHHGDIGAAGADIILPGCAYTEKTATYVNTEGRAQRGLQAVSPPGEAKEDWKIITALSHALEEKLNSLQQKPLSYISLEDIQQDLEKCHPAFQHLFQIVKTPWHPLPHYPSGTLSQNLLTTIIDNFYVTNTICRHSLTMLACVREIMLGHPPPLKNDLSL